MILRLVFLLSSLVSASVTFADASADEKTAFRVAKLFYAARAAIGERTSFTDDPTSSSNSRAALLDSIRLSFERLAGEKLDEKSDPHVSTMWQAIENVVDRAMKGDYKGNWKDHPNFPGKLIPARFGNEVTMAYNKLAKASRVKWTTSDEYLVNPNSRADAWEQGVIKNKFKSASWKQGDTVFETVNEGGKSVSRFALPEYFKTSCMNCHGGEMGKVIHRGKGAAGTNTFGGLLSVRIEK